LVNIKKKVKIKKKIAIAIIPARKNSIRIKSKNTKNFNGKPIILYTLDQLKKSKIFKLIVVSSDCEKINKISIKFGANTILKRRKSLSNNKVGIVEVLKDSIINLKKKGYKFDYVCCAFAAAPNIKKKYLLKGFELLKKGKYDFVFSAVNYGVNIQKSFIIKKNLKLLFKKKIYLNKYKVYFDAAQFYWGRTNTWLKKKTTFTKNSNIIEIDRKFAQDINDINDWKHADFLYKANIIKKKT